MVTVPNELKVETVRSLSEFTELSEAIRDNETTWYRGCGKSSYRLTPTLYRHPVIREPDQLAKVEASIMSHFKDRSVPYLTRSLPNDWEVLFLMQHHGVPTRLLDWTENPFISLYFAISAAPSSTGTDGQEFLEDAAVWILKPDAWNNHVLQYLTYEDGILSVGDPVLAGYSVDSNGPSNVDAVALFGIYNSPRIVAQRGVFTMFGQSTTPMEEVLDGRDFPEGCLTKVTLPKDALPDLSRSIFAIGITDSVVWPDLDGLAAEIKRQFGFEVKNR